MARKIGIAWYRPWEWEKLRQAAHDAEQLADTHREWLREAKKRFSKLRAAGIDCERVTVGVDELIAWCAERGVLLNGEARGAFVAEKLGLRHEAQGGDSNTGKS